MSTLVNLVIRGAAPGDRYQRLGYTDDGPPVIAAGIPPLWPMWYQPTTDRP